MKRGRVILGALAVAVALAGCAGSLASSDVAPLATSTYVQQDTAQFEASLTANIQKDFNPAHPVKSVDTAVQATFPQGDMARIESYAVKQFTPADATSKTARDAWVQKVVAYALTQGALPSPGSADIPGYSSSPSAAASVSS